MIIVVPGIALVGILGENGLSDPDMSFPFGNHIYQWGQKVWFYVLCLPL